MSSKWLPLTAVSIERVASSYTVLGRRRNPAMSRSRGWSVPAGLRASVPMQETRVLVMAQSRVIHTVQPAAAWRTRLNVGGVLRLLRGASDSQVPCKHRIPRTG